MNESIDEMMEGVRVMKLAFIFISFMLLSGCTMTNDKIIEEADKCRAAGMGIYVIKSKGVFGGIQAILCDPLKAIDNGEKE